MEDTNRRKYELLLEEIGFFLNSVTYEYKAFLDLDSWDVVPCAITSGEKAYHYPEEGHRLIAIENRPSFESYNTMINFLDKVEDENQKNRLSVILKQSHPFRRFRKFIHEAGLAQLWHIHLNEELRDAAKQWLKEHEVTIENDRLSSPQAFEFHFVEYFKDELIDPSLFQEPAQ